MAVISRPQKTKTAASGLLAPSLSSPSVITDALGLSVADPMLALPGLDDAEVFAAGNGAEILVKYAEDDSTLHSAALHLGGGSGNALLCDYCNTVRHPKVAWCPHVRKVISSRWDTILIQDKLGREDSTEIVVPVTPSEGLFVIARVSLVARGDAQGVRASLEIPRRGNPADTVEYPMGVLNHDSVSIMDLRTGALDLLTGVMRDESVFFPIQELDPMGPDQGGVSQFTQDVFRAMLDVDAVEDRRDRQRKADAPEF